jgi:hypothetical protein
VVSARVNLLTKTEEFTNAVWTKFNAAATSTTAVTDPLGGTTASKLVPSAGLSNGQIYNGTPVTVVSGVSYTTVTYVRAAELGFAFVTNDTRGSRTQAGVCVNLTTGEKTNAGADGTYTVTSFGNGWWQVLITTAATTTAGYLEVYPLAAAGTNSSYTGNGTSGIYIWGADLRPTNQGVGLPAYQRVNTSTDYDSTGFPVYIKPNGSNQFMQTNSINFTATDKMTVWQGVRKLDSTTRIINELSVNFNSNTGSFFVVSGTETGPLGAVDCYASASRGSATASSNQAAQIASTSLNTAVLAITHDIAGALSTIRQNTVAGTNGTAAKGTGNFGNYAQYFYARAGTSLFFNGNDYGSIARGAASTAAQITSTETYINSKTKAY